MSEQTPEPQQPEPTEPQQPAEAPDVASLPAWAREAITKANNEAARYRTQVRELEPKAQQFTQLEEASKSELQRQTEALEAARQQGEQAQRDALRYRIALDHKLTSEDITRLAGQTEDELKANAEWLASVKAAATPPAPAPVPQRPAEQLRPGATPANQLNEDDALYQQIYGSTPQ